MCVEYEHGNLVIMEVTSCADGYSDRWQHGIGHTIDWHISSLKNFASIFSHHDWPRRRVFSTLCYQFGEHLSIFDPADPSLFHKNLTFVDADVTYLAEEILADISFNVSKSHRKWCHSTYGNLICAVNVHIISSFSRLYTKRVTWIFRVSKSVASATQTSYLHSKPKVSYFSSPGLRCLCIIFQRVCGCM